MLALHRTSIGQVKTELGASLSASKPCCPWFLQLSMEKELFVYFLSAWHCESSVALSTVGGFVMGTVITQ